MSSSLTVPSARRATAFAPLAAALVLLLLPALPAHAAADGPVSLGTAGTFAVLAGARITNTGPTAITGDVGTFPTTTRTGFGSVVLTGTDHGGDAVTQGAKDALVTAYDDAFGRTPATPHSVELGGAELTAGVYTSPTFGLTGTLTLDAEGNADAQFVFQAASTLIAEAYSTVVLRNGASPCNVVWQVGSSATFKTGTRFVGDVLAYTSVTAQTGAAFRGRLLARNGAVTLDTNTITNATCPDAVSNVDVTAAPAASPTVSAVAATPATVPAPAADANPNRRVAPAAPPARNMPAASAAPAAPGRPAGPPPAAPATPNVPRDSGAAPPAGPSLPRTGLSAVPTALGLLLLAVGVLLVGAGAPAFHGRHAVTR